MGFRVCRLRCLSCPGRVSYSLSAVDQNTDAKAKASLSDLVPKAENLNSKLILLALMLVRVAHWRAVVCLN